MRPFPCCCYFVYLQSKPNFLSWRCLNQAIGAGSGLQLFCYRGWGAERTLACFSPYGFSIRNVSTYGFRIMASSECGRAVIAGYVGQLLEHCFNPFKGKCFEMYCGTRDWHSLDLTFLFNWSICDVEQPIPPQCFIWWGRPRYCFRNNHC